MPPDSLLQAADLGSAPSLRDQMLPTESGPIWALLKEAGFDTRAWESTKDGRQIDKSDHTHLNNQWSFGDGETDPVALCIWHEDVDWSTNPPTFSDSDASYIRPMTALYAKAKGQEQATVKRWLQKAADFRNRVWLSWKARRPVTVILVAGRRSGNSSEAHTGEKAEARRWDRMPWYVHSFDGPSGAYRLVRGNEPPPATQSSPFEDQADPGLDPAFQAYIGTLSDTEREAAIKARVGQGKFRQDLIDRWKKCMVTGESQVGLLIASHIKPWSQCESAFERLSSSNGLLLSPNLDKLFDQGLITFDVNFKMKLSSKLKVSPTFLGGEHGLRWEFRERAADLKPFLAWHERHRFQP